MFPLHWCRMSEQFTFCIKLPNKVLSPNYAPASRRGCIAKAVCAKAQKQATIEAIQQHYIETLPWGQCEVQVRLYFKHKRRRDTDNAIAALKSMYDGIVIEGVVKDDAPEYMIRSEPAMLVDKESPRAEITIKRIK